MHNSEFTQQDGRKNRTANACVWQTLQAYYLCVLWWSSMKLMYSGEVRRKSSWNKIIVTLVTQGFPSSFLPVLLRKLTNIN